MSRNIQQPLSMNSLPKKNTDHEFPDGVQESHPSVNIGNTVIHVEIARTKADIDRGLSRRKSLEEFHGMLFIFDHNARFRFWMKGMRFSIDIIWIGENMSIVHITPNIPPPPFFSRPVFYSPLVPARYVLEVNAGFCSLRGIKVGDHAGFVSI